MGSQGLPPPTGSRGGSPSNIATARMPGVYAQGLCTMQSQPSVLIGIENSHYLIKNRLFLQAEGFAFSYVVIVEEQIYNQRKHPAYGP